ncbi:MAG TPA: SRPBCC domain-containing protein [Solirubrobacteraceae bacterium]
MTGQVRIERIIEAPRAEVFRAWTDPDELRRWWGPGEYATRHAEIDLRPGGDYLLVIQAAEGDPMHLAGTFHEVVAPERLVYSWRWVRGWSDPAESIVSVEFEDLGERTRVVLVHGGLDASPDADGYRMGWESGLDKLAATVSERS